MKRNIVITGGAGFIGSHVVRLFVNKYPEYNIINLDKLTYAGNLANLKDIEDKPNYKFVKMDICDFDAFYKLMQDEKIDGIIHLAAESHVDRSIKNPFTFARTNVMGTLSLLQTAKLYWESQPTPYVVDHSDELQAMGKELTTQGSQLKAPCRFYHISTDEVYGALEMTHPEGIPAPFSTKASSEAQHEAYGEDFFVETTKYNPHSPYSASKASSDHFVRAFHDTYGMPTIVTNCSNNYGPYQFPEKLIPLFINNIRHRKPLPIYGKGENVRDWLFVEDHARAIDLIFHNGKVAETYNIGGFNEWKNIDIIKVVIATVDKLLGRAVLSDEQRAMSISEIITQSAHLTNQGSKLTTIFPDMDLITYVTDRLGHDARYAIDSRKLQDELGWEPFLQFEEGIEKTVKWYLENEEWLDNVTSGDYQLYYEKMYTNR
jgi:dTDP-glucose 4,6-dehydratase